MRQVYTLQVMCICQSPALLSSVLKATTAAAFTQSVSRLNSPFVLSKTLTKWYYLVVTRHFSIYLWMQIDRAKVATAHLSSKESAAKAKQAETLRRTWKSGRHCRHPGNYVPAMFVTGNHTAETVGTKHA